MSFDTTSGVSFDRPGRSAMTSIDRITRRLCLRAALPVAALAAAALLAASPNASAHAPAASARPAATPAPLGVPGRWSLIFDDEFDGRSLDLDKWTPNWLAATSTAITKPANTHEVACYDPSLVREHGGVLRIEAIAKRCVADNGRVYRYASGAIQSRDHFSFTYGVFEARIWLPAGDPGIVDWPAFWATGTGRWPATGEIDVMEALGGALCWHFHHTGGISGHCYTRVASGWHVFAANWEPGRIVFYFDGRPVGQVTRGVTSSPMYLVLGLGLSPTISGPVRTPSSIRVDYVRVWQRRA